MGLKRLDEILQLPPIKWLVQDILPRKGVLVLGGPPKRGKSRLVLSELLGMTHPLRSMFGAFENFASNALIYNAEGGVQGIRMRSGMYARMPGHQLQSINVVDEDTKPLVGNNGVVDMQVYARMVDQIRGHDLFILDPLVCFHSVDENDNQAMTLVMNTIRGLTEDANSAALVVHHTAKLPDDMSLGELKKQGGMKLRGASAIFAAADNICMAYPHKGGGMSLNWNLRYAPDPGELVMLPCACMGEVGCGRFYRQVDMKVPVGEVKAWKQDHPKGDVGLMAKGFNVTQAVVEGVWQ